MLTSRPPLTLVLLALAGCVMSPLNGDSVELVTDSLALSGYTLQADQTVRLFASPNPDGPFSSWPGANTPSGSTGVMLDYSGGSVLLYPWSMSRDVPAVIWSSEPGPGACTTPVTYVQVQTKINGSWFPFYTFDPPGLFQPDHYTCISNGIANGDSLYEVVPACASDESPTMRIEAAPVCP
ncbi:MAG: hypothetical protein JKY37_14165 [Nannocystaceae bacterium]|nr:hypothetical protein [Nannocystaceae bacterium]